MVAGGGASGGMKVGFTLELACGCPSNWLADVHQEVLGCCETFDVCQVEPTVTGGAFGGTGCGGMLKPGGG